MTLPSLPAAESTGAVRRLSRSDWRATYARRLFVTDLLVLVWVIVGVQLVWFGLDTADLSIRGRLRDIAVSYTAISVVIVVSWMLLLSIFGTRGYRVVGTGSEEYKLIANASIRLFGLLAIVAFLLHIDFARGYVLLAFPLGMVLLMFSRWLWRQWLNAQRLSGRFSSIVVLAGSLNSVQHIAEELTRRPEAGYRIAGVCIPVTKDNVLPGTSIPVLGDLTEVQSVLTSSGADTVIITSSDHLPPKRVRELSWGLEPGRQHLVVAPSLTGIGGPRIHTRPVAGLPLIHVETPQQDARNRFVKRAFDIVGSAILILIASPILLAIAISVKASSPGPVIFRQQRVGLMGERFQMLKFRSMVANAESRLDELESRERAVGNEVMFKLKDDPRVTRLGGFLRRYSLDELPQLFNVLVGDMSIVGPRPPLDREVSRYEENVHRRFLVKPGITGLWQVSGRSSLSWEDTVRLDLYYVENWSITGDLIILWRTFKAVVARTGAY